jgi:hypothetical protein
MSRSNGCGTKNCVSVVTSDSIKTSNKMRLAAPYSLTDSAIL